MINENIKNKKDRFISKIMGKTNPESESVLRDKAGFCQNFWQKWNTRKEVVRLELISTAGLLEPAEGILFILHGTHDPALAVRQLSREILTGFIKTLNLQTEGNNKTILKRTTDSAFVSSAIYQDLFNDPSFDQVKQNLRLLLSINEYGPYLVWKYFCSEIIKIQTFIDILRAFPQQNILTFIYQYSLSEVSIRRKYAREMNRLSDRINDRTAMITLLIRIFDHQSENETYSLDLIFRKIAHKLDLERSIKRKELRSDNPKDVKHALKAIGLITYFKNPDDLLIRLFPDEPENIRVLCLKILRKPLLSGNEKIIKSLHRLIIDDNSTVAIEALKTLITFGAPRIDRIVIIVLKRNMDESAAIYKALCMLERIDLDKVLLSLPVELSKEIRSILTSFYFKYDKKGFDRFLDFYTNSKNKIIQNTLIRIKSQLRQSSKEKSYLALEATEKATSEALKKAVFSKLLTGRKLQKTLGTLSSNQVLKNTDLSRCTYKNISINNKRINDSNLESSVFSHTDIKTSRLIACNLSKSYFTNVTFTDCDLSHTLFEHSVLNTCRFINTNFKAANFNSTIIIDCNFENSQCEYSSFISAIITNSRFSNSNLSNSIWFNSELTRIFLKNTEISYSEFIYNKINLCTFNTLDLETHIRDTQTPDIIDFKPLEREKIYHTDLKLHREFFCEKFLNAGYFNILLFIQEMKKQEKRYQDYNTQKIELAFDIFDERKGDIFVLVPYILHHNIISITSNIMVEPASTHIYNYIAPNHTIKLARHYFGEIHFSSSDLMSDTIDIQGIFTIGSIGSIAQSIDSDIDYWICIDESSRSKPAITFLKQKLQAIENWALDKFDTELHFFIVTPEMVRRGYFGVSDKESSGSAQGKILIEEFYRTMIHVAGKVPFWCVIPPWMTNKDYEALYNIACMYDMDYLNFGNVSIIPVGEYFGASMWQLFKSLKSPFKSVMKMALLEKSIYEETRDSILCNIMKADWSKGKKDYITQDSYLILYDRIQNFYERINNPLNRELIEKCFLMKIGISSMSELSGTTFGIRKNIIESCSEACNWNSEKFIKNGRYRNWNFESISDISTEINHFMINTFSKLSSLLKGSDGTSNLISDKDITMLGRKIFVQFAREKNRIESLPLIVMGESMFQSVYLKYTFSYTTPPFWELYHIKQKNIFRDDTKEDILIKKNHIVEIAAWFVYNGLYRPDTVLKVLPNQSELILKDIIGLFTEMNRFFKRKEFISVSQTNFLEQSTVLKVFITGNLNMPRKADRIYEYSAIILTSWGEMFCRHFKNKTGFGSFIDVATRAKVDLKLEDRPYQFGGYLPDSSRKRIMAGRKLKVYTI